MKGLLIASLGLWGSLAAVAAPEEGKRVALVIGNDTYAARPLRNAVNDARAMDKALQAAGFRTLLRENVNKVALEHAIVEFLQAIGPDDTALFYYAGHAVQIENENFLIPVDFEAANSVIEAKFRSLSVALLFDYLSRARARRSIVILDACRSNPVSVAQSLQAGLAIPLNAGKETYIAFSTSPNRVATDNPDGKNSWFTEALADLITQPGLTIDEVFTRVRQRVERATDGKQTPWSQTSLTSRFSFHAASSGDDLNDPTVAERWFDDARRREQREDWAAAIDLVDRVLKRKPGPSLAEAARRKMPYLEARRDAQARFDANDFAAAAALYEKALELDPFAIDAGIQGANSYLLADRFPEAVRLLQSVRRRGTSAYVAKAGAALKELAAVSPEASRELAAGVPPPPPIEEVFAGARFGVPDFEAGEYFQRRSPVDLTPWANQIMAAHPAPAPPQPAVVPDPGAGVTQARLDAFHVEVVSPPSARDIRIRRLAGAPEPQSGYLQIDGPPGPSPVLLDGEPAAPQMPARLPLIPGKYEIRTVQQGRVLSRQEVEVKPLSTVAITVQR